MNKLTTDFDKIYSSLPVNRISSLVVNQCDCKSEYQLNGALEQRKILREERRKVASVRGAGSKVRLQYIDEKLRVLNVKLKPYDKRKGAYKFKSHNDAFKYLVKELYGEGRLASLNRMAKRLYDEN